MKLARLQRGRLTNGQWRRLLNNAFSEPIIDHYIVTIVYPAQADGMPMEKTVSCCAVDANFRRAHGWPTETDWMDFALKRIEDGQTLERDPGGKPVWRKS